MVRRVPSKHRNAKIVRQTDSRVLTRLALLLLCGLVLTGGFLYACRQHFASLRFGYQTETLRRERDRLQEERRRLLLQREGAASPNRLERAARQLGMQPMQPEQLDPLRTQQARAAEKKSSDSTSSTVEQKKKASAAKATVKGRPVTPR